MAVEKNVFRFTFPLEQSWQHSIFRDDVGDFNWFSLHLAVAHHPSLCYTGMWGHHQQVKWGPNFFGLAWCCPSKWTGNHVWHTSWHHQIIDSGWHSSLFVIFAVLWQYNWWVKYNWCLKCIHTSHIFSSLHAVLGQQLNPLSSCKSCPIWSQQHHWNTTLQLWLWSSYT
jgi:hypothetical protein